MDSNNRATAVGVFDAREQASRAIDELRRAGFADERIGVVDRAAAPVAETMADEAATGAVGGAAVGALGGLAVAAGLLAPIGPVVAGGALAAIAATAAAGAAAGGLLGLLVGMGFTEEEARYYEGELRAGRTLVTVRADERYEEAVAILRRCGAREPADVPAVPML